MDATFGQRIERQVVADAQKIESELRLIRIPWPAEALTTGYTGARVLALSARTGHVYEGYAPYGEVYGWTRLVLKVSD